MQITPNLTASDFSNNFTEFLIKNGINKVEARVAAYAFTPFYGDFLAINPDLLEKLNNRKKN